jgi:response regulator of citrate/malate metabolism
MHDWRVLVVEDDRIVARLHCRFIAEVPGFSVAGVAASATQAAEMVRVMRPDLLLLDIGLPGEDGISLLRRLRAAAEEVEVIAVTAATATATVRAAVQLGAVDYLVKPFDQDRLRKSLRLFERRMLMLRHAQLGQRDVDLICSEGPNVLRWLPRDVSGPGSRRSGESCPAPADRRPRRPWPRGRAWPASPRGATSSTS